MKRLPSPSSLPSRSLAPTSTAPYTPLHFNQPNHHIHKSPSSLLSQNSLIDDWQYGVHDFDSGPPIDNITRRVPDPGEEADPDCENPRNFEVGEYHEFKNEYGGDPCQEAEEHQQFYTFEEGDHERVWDDGESQLELESQSLSLFGMEGDESAEMSIQLQHACHTISHLESHIENLSSHSQSLEEVTAALQVENAALLTENSKLKQKLMTAQSITPQGVVTKMEGIMDEGMASIVGVVKVAHALSHQITLLKGLDNIKSL